MTYGRVSPKYQIVIPKEVRKVVDIKPGQRLMIYAKDNVIYLIPEVGVSQLRGICKGVKTSGVREREDRI
ncbi:MAG: AbrB/MazE/SpoVT family DNA-binding domain-containing protein [Pseudomonadota bacterium]